MIYFIGGSPCSGKSTVASALSEKCGLHYFKVDDHLDRYMKMGAEDGKRCCKREWVPYVLAGCSDKAKAFENWMDRDALFAKAVQQQCSETGYDSLINNGEISAEELADRVAAHFGLE